MMPGQFSGGSVPRDRCGQRFELVDGAFQHHGAGEEPLVGRHQPLVDRRRRSSWYWSTSEPVCSTNSEALA